MSDENLKGLRVAVLATDGFEEKELTSPVEALRKVGAKVDIVSLKSGAIQGVQHDVKGKRVDVDNVISSVSASAYDALMLPGGAMNADAMRMEEDVKRFISEIDSAAKPIAFICHAPWELISAGCVEGRTLTSYHTIQDDVRNAGANWVDREVVRERNWVSSRKPDDLPAFNKEMISLFACALEERVRSGAARG